MKGALPAAVKSFFDQTSHEVGGLYKPDWLLSEVGDPVWIVDNGVDLRRVGGAWKGGIQLRWDYMLPNGALNELPYCVALEQAKMCLVTGFDGALVRKSGSLRTIVDFHRNLVWFIEFLAVREDVRLRSHGLRAATVDQLVEFLDASVTGGVTGTGCFIERWETFIGEQAALIGATHDERVSWLKSNGAYGSDGLIGSEYVSRAIRADVSRLRVALAFRRYLFRYALPNAKGLRYEHTGTKSVAQLARWSLSMSDVLKVIPHLDSSEWANTLRVGDAVRPYIQRASARTKTMPASTARALVAGCCEWMTDVLPEMLSFSRQISACIAAHGGRRKHGRLGSAISRAEEMIELPTALRRVGEFATRPRPEDSEDPRISRNVFPSFMLIRLHVAVCFSLTALLACCRRNEVLELSPSSRSRIGDREFLSISLRKTGVDTTRQIVKKPIPILVKECLESLEELKSIWAPVAEADDPLLESRCFFKVSSAGMFPLESEDVYTALSALSAFLDLKRDSGEPWVVLPHQLRRHFAMTFFHATGKENSLPALAWFMGHDDIASAWRYVKEELNGAEISDAEAAMATSAIYSDDQTSSVCRLREVVKKHFRCDKISLMAESEVQDFLELLAERGAFTATPTMILTADKARVTVLIHIKEGVLNASLG